MSLAPKLAEYIEACFPGLWIVSSEREEALREIAHLAHQREWSLASVESMISTSSLCISRRAMPPGVSPQVRTAAFAIVLGGI